MPNLHDKAHSRWEASPDAFVETTPVRRMRKRRKAAGVKRIDYSMPADLAERFKAFLAIADFDQTAALNYLVEHALTAFEAGTAMSLDEAEQLPFPLLESLERKPRPRLTAGVSSDPVPEVDSMDQESGAGARLGLVWQDPIEEDDPVTTQSTDAGRGGPTSRTADACRGSGDSDPRRATG